MKNSIIKNDSEDQLHIFVRERVFSKEYPVLSLRPQGDDTIIDSHNCTNLVIVKTSDNNTYYFGGISESTYDRLCDFIEEKKLSNQ